MANKMFIVVKTNFEGTHYWKDAPIEVAFLRKPHRHIFYVEAKIPVMHDDRQLEFFIVKDFLKAAIEKEFPEFDLGGVSCEMIAEKLLSMIADQYGIRKGISVSVFEDNENGSIVEQ